MQRALPEVFMRGGTSKALMLLARDLPPDREDWAPLFMAAMGTPDPYAMVPFVCLVSPPADSPTLSGDIISGGDVDLLARVISNGQSHRALRLTISLCTAVAAMIDGTVVAQTLSPAAASGALRLGMPSGVLQVSADVEQHAGKWTAQAGSFYRTARRLFDGRVWVPGSAASPL